ncbi:MAG: acyl-CoA dehydrogenase family protein [Candidatus Hydrogenedentes bacterium]|nr:acyl-CoA dehydrogenase family protein [Candidatus Hydrogenedentota bacterium]
MASGEDKQAKDAAMELAEAARETEWQFPSFTAEMFKGNFRWDLVHPYPEQDPEDKKIGDELQAKVKEVLEKYVDPIEIDRTGEYPKAAIKALSDLGIFSMKISKEYGGLGLSQINYARMLSFIASYCQSTVTWVSAHQSIGVPQPLKDFGTPEQKKKFLPKICAGAISAFALTEPDVGSDPAKMGTTATPSEDGSYYLLNGDKLWTTNGPDADIIVVMAKTPPKIKNGREIPQISAFVFETKDANGNFVPGFEVVHRCKFMGLKGLSNGLLRFNNAKVPAENIIGKPGMGLKIALTTLNTGRLGVPAAGGGACKSFLDDAAWWAAARVQWGQPVGKHQAISKKIANYAATTFAMQAMVQLTCSFADKKNADIRLEAAAAKYFCTEQTWSICDDLLQVMGGRGYEMATSLYNRGEKPFTVERSMRDMRVGRIFEGSSEVMHLIMAREAMDTHFKLAMPIIQPKPGQKEGKVSLILKAMKFYAGWYPKTWMPAQKNFGVKHLSASSRGHLKFAAKTCKKLARRLFHTMAKYGPKLEYEQVILGNFVEIGVDLFVMAAALSYAEHLLAKNPNDRTPEELADLFCEAARHRIAVNFDAVKHNFNRKYKKVANNLMDGKYRWLIQDVYNELPPQYRDYAKNAPKSVGAEDLASARK